MQRRTLGRHGPTVSELGLGCMGMSTSPSPAPRGPASMIAPVRPTDTGIAVPFRRHRFASLEIGGVAFRNTEIGIVRDHSEVRFRHFAPNDF